MKLWQAKQQKLRGRQWGKAHYDMTNQSLSGLNELKISYDLFDDKYFMDAQKIYGQIKDRDLEFLANRDIIEFLEEIENSAKKGATIQRYKGLGEMNPEQLWETTMTKENRTLLRVQIGDEVESEDKIRIFMGSEVEPRRNFIQAHAKEVKNLDI